MKCSKCNKEVDNEKGILCDCPKEMIWGEIKNLVKENDNSS